MRENLFVSASPHITQNNGGVRRIMIDVLIALAPVVVAATVFFGYLVLVNVAVAVAACMGFELLYDCGIRSRFKKGCVKSSSMFDGSSAVTGVILALNFPTVIDIASWNMNIYNPNVLEFERTASDVVFSFETVIMLIIASAFAIVLVKMLFGGIGKNFMNPAAAGRAFAFIIVPFAAVQTLGLGALDASSGATWLADRGTASGNQLLQMLLGNTGSAAVGETCAIAIIIGYIYLVARRVIDFRLPLVTLASAFAFALLFDGIKGNLDGTLVGVGDVFANATAHVLSGGLLFGAVYMATDYATNPNTIWGRVIFAVGLGLITMLIRVFAGFPEGMSFAILIMNIVTPLIDRYVYPRPFGYVKPEKPKKTKKTKAKGEAAA